MQQRRERPALDVLQDDETADRPVAIDLVNGDDAGVLDPGGEPGLLQEAVEVLGASKPVGSRHLDRHQPVQLLVPAEVHPAEVALTQEPDDDKRADPLGPNGAGKDGLCEHLVLREPTAVFLWRRPLTLRERKRSSAASSIVKSADR